MKTEEEIRFLLKAMYVSRDSMERKRQIKTKKYEMVLNDIDTLEYVLEE